MQTFTEISIQDPPIEINTIKVPFVKRLYAKVKPIANAFKIRAHMRS